MPWFKVDDGLAFHHKAAAAGNRAVGLWVRAGSFSAAQLTEGFVPTHMLGALGGVAADATRLVAVGLWYVVDGGWQFHQWDEYQPSKAEVEEDRRRARERQRKWRDKRREAQGTDTVTDDVSNGVTDTVTTPISNASHARPYPDPTRPDLFLTAVDLPPPETLREPENAGGGPNGQTANGMGALIAQVQAIRPGWTPTAIHAAINAASHDGHPWPAIGPALLELARLPDTTSPNRLTHPGPWWKTQAGIPPPPGVDQRAIDEGTAAARREQAERDKQTRRGQQLDDLGDIGTQLRIEAKADLRDRGQPTPAPLVDIRAHQLAQQRDLLPEASR